MVDFVPVSLLILYLVRLCDVNWGGGGAVAVRRRNAHDAAPKRRDRRGHESTEERQPLLDHVRSRQVLPGNQQGIAFKSPQEEGET